ncbi:flagellar motor switch protein FliN/FliY [Loktanella fryxellensis]|uniref:Flagellar motor switch protein FliN n=1 Tax=Loktanella fryxellensis TaxID=245187 RepID=A0A1H7ZRN3_9RHOB|nr:FliM/FliN family flagellar motor switch protein [Loktanella fryxellensis]SEM60208.1 flagellar motor switch protein FliN/FliY [Loktanella fryxellensis]
MDDNTAPTVPATPDLTARGARLLQQIPIEVTVSVGRARPLVQDLLNLSESAILRLDRRIDDPVEIYVGDKLIARGELQEMEGADAGQLAVRLTEVVGDARDLG